MRRKLSAFVVLCVAMLAVGCVASTAQRADNFQPLTVSFEWDGNAGTLSSPNPEIHVANIPDGTAFLEVKMSDAHRPGFNHGGGIVPYTGSPVIPVGALRSYKGPQPPAPEVHSYTFTVRALNQDKTILLGEGRATRKYPEK